VKSELIPLSEQTTWRQALAGLPHALAHTWEYNRALSLTPAYDKIFLWRGEKDGATVACPLLERRWQGAREVVTPYGFSGFAARGAGSGFLAAWRQQAQAQGWVCGYLGLHPLLDTRGYPADEVSCQSEVYALNLAPTEAGIAAGFSHNLRARLQQWEKSGSQLTDDTSACRRFFREQYPAFRRRVKASAAYDFSGETLTALLAHPNVFIVGGLGPLGLEAVSVFGYTPDCGEYLFNVSLEPGRHHSARLLWAGIQELKRRGVPVLNLGGGIRPGDGLAEFKARFGGAQLPLRALKQIYQALSYRRLCLEAGADSQTRAGYFPAYRAPKVSQSAANQQGCHRHEVENE
jgi:hypothetical protein